MRIAVATQNYRTIRPHAGKCRQFVVFDAESGTEPREVERIDLPAELTIRNLAGDTPHPLDSMNAIIVAGAGAGFVGRMAARGVDVVITDLRDPSAAVKQYAEGTLRTRAGDNLENGAGDPAEILKAMANEVRLNLLCALAKSEQSVSELERALGLGQSTISQHLSRLRRADLVTPRHAGNAVYYRLANSQVRRIVDAVHEAYCRTHKASENGN